MERRFPRRHLARLKPYGIRWYGEPIAHLDGRKGRLQRIVFADGRAIERRAMFLSVGQRQASDLAAQLGCEFTRKGAVRTGKREATAIPGLYVAGDASHKVQLAVIAAAEGAHAAFAINTALTAQHPRR